MKFDYRRHCQPSRHNMASVLEQPQVIRDYLAAKCSEGRVLGPLDPTALPQVHISQFGVPQKAKRASGD